MRKIYLFLLPVILLSQALTAQNLLSSEFKGGKTAAELSLQFFTSFNNGAEYYKVTYETKDLDGNTTTASGLVLIPDDLSYIYPRAVYQHGTAGTTDDVPSNVGFDSDLAIALCGKGYVVVAPDYLGLGENPGLHPYVHAESEAWVAADLLRAADQFLDENDVFVNGQLFITGYSQGGHSAMALHQMMELELANEFTVTASAPMSGPYSIGEVMLDLILSEEPYARPGYAIYTFVSYQEVYGNLYTNIEEAFKSPYQELILDFAAGEISLNNMNEQFTQLLIDNEGVASPVLSMQPDYVQAVLDNPDHPVNVASQANNVYDWAPTAPTRLYYCEADEIVPFENSTLAEATMQANGAADVASFNVNSAFNHTFCAFAAPFEAIDFFAEYQILEPLSSTTVAASSPLELFPNPVDEVAYIKNFPSEGQAHIFNMSGQVLHSQNIFQGDNQLIVSDLPEGIYLLEIVADGFFWTEKLVVK